ncbi:acetolactate synthase AlsS [Heyndrickxia ginsengihumi]|uniref:Acetolactate synthase n=1 Tax=Heyndrickxia ginsengihumi TaxID=363870 RepID=A0A0A6XYP4_9BACI|nr:acetolactate synthase AlsS [Heyndrickxia ginsengihumi]KHD85247.1 acetolactate synthase [Heyndrickxia ginsengihumi]MBE6184562.1 acetolactate synthase AlsS [Bacillus sp. (in: firmicutes)]MCM3024487.1 acetolactate synthase AlsS [Heyndrickxia ginsengihumi]NEY21650.1 acetolactate synthase AlsS [Heyndrickxia ginsengihumi]
MSQEKKSQTTKTTTAADLIVDCLIKQEVPYVFGIPGAKIDAVFDVLQERGPELIVTRHEQNAAFMAAAMGRLTGKPGVCIATSGPGASNLATGLVTANTEGDPVVALAGAVQRADSLKKTHQSMDNVALFQPITKYSAEVVDPNSVPEVMTNAFRSASSAQAGAAFVSFPQDVLSSPATVKALGPLPSPKLGRPSEDAVKEAVEAIQHAKLPVILVGMRASRPQVVAAVRALLKKMALPVVETFQAAGLISRELESHFFGRIGLFRNQPGDILLEHADVVVTIGYDSVEYDPKYWNGVGERKIIHIDEIQADIDHDYQPEIELVGDIVASVDSLRENLSRLNMSEKGMELLDILRNKLNMRDEPSEPTHPNLVHPLQFIRELRSLIDDNVTVTCDVGSHYIWMARHFRSYEPNRLLFSNGMQTLGVALPWGIAAGLVNPNEKVVSISGDGGFLFSAMELETAVRLNSPLVHIVWNDGTYDMVAFQQQLKYNRTSGAHFGSIDIVKHAESYGAKGLRVNSPEELSAVLKEALSTEGPVVVDVPIDYKDNIELAKKLLPDQLV